MISPAEMLRFRDICRSVKYLTYLKFL